jgi:ferric-dicitrate binding protein FerR (iron transport regulator)
MTLDEFRLLIPEYLAGQLSGAEKFAFEEFTRSNPEARLELAELRGVWDELAAIEEEQPSAALRARRRRRSHCLFLEQRRDASSRIRK